MWVFILMQVRIFNVMVKSVAICVYMYTTLYCMISLLYTVHQVPVSHESVV